MLERLTPRTDQEQDIAQILRDGRTLCANELGTGKTIVGVESAYRSGAARVLIVAPLVTFTGWTKTVLSQTGKELRAITGRKAGQQAFEDIASGNPGWYIVGWEMMRTLSWAKVPVDFLILDEVAKMSNRKSRQALMAKTIKAERIAAMSATPFGNRIEGSWSVLNMLWPEEYPYYWPFVTKYLRTELDPYAGKKVTGEKVPGGVVDSIPSWMRREAPYDIPLAIHDIEVDMLPAQRKIYQKFEQEAVAWLGDNPLIAELPAVKYMRLRQIALAVPSIEVTDEGEEIVYFEDDAKSAKITAMLEVIDSLPEGEPQLVWSHSKRFINIVAERLRAKGYAAEAFTGDTSRFERERIRNEFGSKVQFICATIQSAGTGLDGFQTVCRVEHLLSLDDNRQNNTQMYGRLMRGGQTRRVNRFVYRSRDTLEVRQMDRIKSDDQMMQESITTESRAA